MISVANPYSNLNLRIPRQDWEAVRRFTTTFRADDGTKADVDKSPFSRYVDIWWASLCVGVREGRRTRSDEWHDFITGVVLNQDPWRIRQLELIAITESGSPDILQESGRVIAIANEYAATGLPILLDAMTGQVDPIWALTATLRGAVESQSTTEPA